MHGRDKTDQVHALRRRRTELAQQGGHLSPMVAGVIDDVLQHLPEDSPGGQPAEAR